MMSIPSRKAPISHVVVRIDIVPVYTSLISNYSTDKSRKISLFLNKFQDFKIISDPEYLDPSFQTFFRPG